MRNFFTLSSLTLFLLAFISCKRNSVALEYTNARGEVQVLTNFSFRFSKPLVNDSLLNRWDSTPYVSFEPKIAGRFRWEHPNELVFSPAAPLPPATRFTVKLSREILQFTSFDRIEKAEELQFHTPDLHLDNNNVTWIAQTDHPGSAVPQVDLYFNYPVSPNAIKDKLKISVAGKPVSFTLQSLSDDSRISVRLAGLPVEDKDMEAQLELAAGLVPSGGERGTSEPIHNKFYIPSPYNLTINDVTADHDGIEGTLLIRTSQQVIDEKISSYIRFSPAVKFSTEKTDEGFLISSDDFDASKSYLLTINKGLKGNIGGVLREQFDKNIAFGELEPSISFANSKAVYLSGNGNRNIEVRIVNVPRVKLIVSKIYENNLLAAQRYGYYPVDKRNGEEQDDYYYDDNEYGNDLDLGDVVYEKEIDTRSLPKYGNSRLLNFDPEDKLADFKGIYHIKIRSAERYWVSDSRFIAKSDLGVMAKEGRNKIVVFVNSIKTAEASAGVNVVAYGSNNQVLGLGTTNADGVAEIGWTRKEFAGFRPAMIITKTDNDFNYLPFGNTQVNLSRFEVGGKRSNATGLDAFIYAERDIYRPGEQIHFSAILRNTQWQSPGELPVILKFLLPNGNELKEFRKSLNAQGSLEGDIDLSASAITGSYTLELYSSNNVLLGSRNFNVEEFVPDRIKVTTTLNKAFLLPGQEAVLDIHAVNFFGPPAANRNYEYEVQLKQKSFRPREFPAYDFDITNSPLSFGKEVNEGKTDGEGNASETYAVPSNFANNGVLQADFYATVFDETGRPVSRNSQLDIYTQDVFFGIGRNEYWYHPLNQPIRFPLIAVDRNQKMVSGRQAEVKVVKHEYRTVLRNTGNYFRYESQEEDKVVAEAKVSVSGNQSAYTFVPRSPGSYEIRVSIPGAGSYTWQTFYSYGHWGGDNNSFEVNSEGNIDIQLDKASYQAGETARALFKTPFSGRMLVTLETDHLVSYQYVQVNNRTASVDFKLTAEHLPNVYISATLIKPHEVSDMPLTVAHGFQNMRVEESSRKIPVEVLAQTAVRSRTHQKVTVKAQPNSFITLAAVDNGVLQVTDFRTPDPYQYFYASRALEVNSYDLYPLLFPELRATLSSTGGDGDLEMSKRTNPMPAKRIKILSYWSGIKQANGNGEAQFEFDIPEFSGEVRLMAVAYRDAGFGHAEAAMKVADPIVLSSALPRFLSPKDSVVMPLTITNTTAKATTATVLLKANGPFSVTGINRQTISLAPNSESRAEFRLLAGTALGVGKVNVEVSALGETFTQETELGVRPASPLQVKTGSGAVTGGTSATLNIETGDFMKGSVDYKLTLARSSALELGEQLRYLVQYPYGCTEQTVSSAFPQLYYSDLARQVNENNAGRSALSNDNIMAAIRKIKLRQLYNGAITLWDGEGTEHWFASVYAAHFLLEAKKAGFDVDRSLLEGLLNYLNARLQNKETIQYFYNGNLQKKIAPKEVPYSLFVLALAGRPNVPSMNYYKANPQLLSLDSKYLLSAAYALSGDKERFKEMLPGSFSGEVSVAQTGGSFYSDIRDEAIALNALVEVDPGNPQVPVMEKHVAAALKSRTWYSTSECAFSFLALGKLARAANQATVNATVKVNGKTVGRTSGEALTIPASRLGNTSVTIETQGSGRMYYFWQSEGISASGTYTEEDNFLRVHRRFFDRNGKPLSSSHFKQNDLVIVQISLDKMYSGRVDNVVITDLLPAGFEIENPRTREIPGMDWIKDASTPTALDVRDDRINLFVDLHRDRQLYYYAVRAVSPGVFQMGPVSAEAMYNGEYHSYHDSGTITISR